MKDKNNLEPSDYITSVSGTLNQSTDKGLKALENIKREAGFPYFSTLYDIDMWREDFKTVETALKALEIIKIKNVNLGLVKYGKDYQQYLCSCAMSEEITEEEFDLLKEVLK